MIDCRSQGSSTTRAVGVRIWDLPRGKVWDYDVLGKRTYRLRIGTRLGGCGHGCVAEVGLHRY